MLLRQGMLHCFYGCSVFLDDNINISYVLANCLREQHIDIHVEQNLTYPV